MAKKPARKPASASPKTIISKSSGREVDRKRSLAARKAAATRKANQLAAEQTSQRTALRLHHKILATGAILAVVAVTVIGIHAQLDAFAATAKKTTNTKTKEDAVKAAKKNAEDAKKKDKTGTTKSAQSIVKVGSGNTCMDNDHNQKKNGNKIQLYTCNATKAQTWTINGSGQVKNANGYCLDTPGTKPKAGDKATLRQCNKSKEMAWTYSNGTLVNKASGLCLGGTGNKTQLSLSKCKTASKDQKFSYSYMTVTKGAATSKTAKGSKDSATGRDGSKNTPSKGADAVTLATDANGKPVKDKKGNPVYVDRDGHKYTKKQALAKKIISSGEVTFLNGVGTTSAQRRNDFAKIANGDRSGNSRGCGMNIRVLQVVNKLIENHKSVEIGDTNSGCDGNNVSGRSAGSRHRAGNGSAIDIVAVDGVALTGANAKSIEILKELKPLLIQGFGTHNASQVGQSECRAKAGTSINLGKVVQFADACNHVHIDFPPWSDDNLKYVNGVAY